MVSYLPASREIRVTQQTGVANSKALEALDQLLLILPRRIPAALWRRVPKGTTLQTLLRKRPADRTPSLVTRLPNKRQTLVVAGKIGPDAEAFERLSFARKLVAAATQEKAGTLGIWVLGFDTDDQERLCEAAVAAALAAGFSLPEFKSKPAPPKIKAVRVLGQDHKLDLRRVAAEARGNNLARWLTALPPNKLDAINYAEMLKELAATNGWDYKRYTTRQLEKLGAGAFLAVAQGNDDDSASLVRLRYRPGARDAAPDLALVGKGIIFDTGGTNLKPFNAMLDMHGDMQGSAVAVGALLAVSELGLPLAVDCWLAITENRTGPRAYKSQDVITAANGKTIQTIHTDAEGRMVLADALTLASREKPGLVIDYATLTGAVINAVTTRYSGVFTNQPDWHPRLKRAGRSCGERVWPFPIGKEFLEDLESDTADIQQCSAKGMGDHILAGSFLAEFVENDTPWIHVDLAASSHKGGLAHIPTTITGFGVRYTMSLILDDRILEAGA
ncbi:MAG TPA: leucyl aminopeptidase family protein [Woeseiaceae bacterium]|jgi:leucyl aminopeptidase|nr:leucyl aminopeptidase family protein [Woeseiaceae bacterium]